jgi:hypothetical protein
MTVITDSSCSVFTDAFSVPPNLDRVRCCNFEQFERDYNKRSFDFLVINVGIEDSPFNFISRLFELPISVSYIIAISNCDWVPTDVSVSASIIHGIEPFDFSIVEQICDEDITNSGVSLFRYELNVICIRLPPTRPLNFIIIFYTYRNTSEIDEDWYFSRNALTRRIPGKLISTVFKARRSAESYI